MKIPNGVITMPGVQPGRAKLSNQPRGKHNPHEETKSQNQPAVYTIRELAEDNKIILIFNLTSNDENYSS